MITPAYLLALGACSDHVSRFAAAFPGGLDLATCDVDATAAAVVAAGLAVEWAVERLLTPAGRAEYERVAAAARAEYYRVAAAARAESDRVVAPARAEYYRVVAPARAESDRVVAPARAEYDRVVAAARAEYDRVVAHALAECDRVVAHALITAAREHGIRQPPVNSEISKDNAT